jgi:hypothetical protein
MIKRDGQANVTTEKPEAHNPSELEDAIAIFRAVEAERVAEMAKLNETCDLVNELCAERRRCAAKILLLTTGCHARVTF